MKKIILATGGTGGHIFPALAVKEELEKQGNKVLFLGDKSLEKFLNKEKDLFRILPVTKHNKTFKGIFKLLQSIFQTFKIYSEFKPDIIIGFGSYASFPPLFVAQQKKIKYFIHEQNANLGKVNRVFSKNAEKIFSSYHELFGIDIKNADKIIFTGNPVRKNIKELINFEYTYPEEKNKFTVFITGGSSGASFFGTELLQSLKFLTPEEKNKLHFIYQVREDEIKSVENFCTENKISAEINTFFYDMESRFKNSHLIIARSGASFLAEATIAGVPLILIPYPYGANNEQYENARILKNQNSCIIVEQKDFEAKKFYDLTINLIQNKKQIIEMSSNLKNIAVIDAEIKIINSIKNIDLL